MSGDSALAQAMLAAARAAGAEAADALVLRGTSVEVGVAQGALEEAGRAESLDLGLRVLIGRAQACVSASDAGPRTLAEMAARAVAMAREAPEDPWCGLATADQLGDLPDIAALELEDPADLPDPARLEDLARAGEAAALAVPGVTQVEQASAGWSRDRVTIAQTNGFAASYGRSSVGLSVSAIAGAGLGRERDYAAEQRRFWADLPDVAGIGAEAGARAVARLHPRKPPGGAHPVIYDERVAAGLIGHVLEAINGATVARGSGWLRDGLGRQILPAGFEIAEDPLIRRGRSSRPFDAEGIAARPRALVRDGVLQSWVLDLATARQLGLATTGNARRGPGGPPSPGVSNIRVTQGTTDRAGLMAAMGTGLLITSLIGASINPTTGDYSRGAAGFWVEGGEIAYPVNEITVAGSLPRMIAGLIPANDADPARAVSVPSLLVEGLTLGV